VDSTSFLAAEERYARRADLVLASARSLEERMRTLSANVLYTPNVADTELFATALDKGIVDGALERIASPRLVFTGAIVEAKLDFALIAAVARANPDWQIVLVGPVGLGDPSTDVARLEAEPNVHLLGPREYRRLPTILRGADAGLIPYRHSQLTDSVFPMKVYEYLAAGLPVVATALPALEGIKEIECGDDPDAFAAAARRALKRDSARRRAKRSSGVAQHSWTARIDQISDAIEAAGG
jgi:glycosyltransferase involved in cell wall biosynthesis